MMLRRAAEDTKRELGVEEEENQHKAEHTIQDQERALARPLNDQRSEEEIATEDYAILVKRAMEATQRVMARGQEHKDLRHHRLWETAERSLRLAKEDQSFERNVEDC